MSENLFLKLSSLYFWYFALLGVMAPYLGLYLEEQGYSLLEISQLLSLLMMTKIVAPILWGSLADKYNKSVLLVRTGSFLTLICYLGFFWVHSFWTTALVIVLFSFFWNAVLPQIEVLTLYNLAGQQNRYSRIRLWGSIGFIFSVVFCGWFFDAAGLAYFPWVLLVIVTAIFSVSLFGFSEVRPSQEAKQAGQAFNIQAMKPWVILFFIVSFLLQVSHGAYYTYFSIYLGSLDYSKIEIGGLWALGVVAEVLMFIVMHRWLRKSSIETIMIVSLLLTFIRWLATASFADEFWVIVIVQCLHAFSFGAMHVASIQFVHRHFEQQNQGRAQALYSSVGFGAGGALGASLSGFVVSSFNYFYAFLFSAVVGLVAAFLVGLIKKRYKKYLEIA
ncbi:MAG: MFS transporter [Oleiphilus sp.]